MHYAAKFFHQLAPITTDTLYIGIEKDQLDQEIEQNTWSISASAAERSAISVEAFEAFIAVVIKNRQNQVWNVSQGHGMLFYMWFDEQASQLRFSVISNIHEKLPFKTKINIIGSPRSIINEFLCSKPEIGWEELEVIDIQEEVAKSEQAEIIQEFILDVYVAKLIK